MSKFTVYITPPVYLEQWLRSHFWDEETSRIVLPRGSVPRIILMTTLRRPPKGYQSNPEEGSLPVAVPSISGIEPSKLCFLAQSGKRAVIGACKKAFQANMINELYPLFKLDDVPITEVIYDFLDKHGIEGTPQNWETCRQIYYRLRDKTIIH